MSLPWAGLTVLQLRHSSQVQIVSLPGLIDRCPTIPLALRRRSEKRLSGGPGAVAIDLAQLINSIHWSQAVCDRCSSTNLCPGPPNLNPACFYWSLCLSPHPRFLQGHLGARLRSPLAQIICLWLIS